MSEGQQTEGQSPRYLVEVGLTNGETLMGEPAGEARLQANFALLNEGLAAQRFVVVSDRLVVRSEDVRYVRIREAGSSSPGLLETIKDKIGGSEVSSGYGDEPGQTGYGQGGGDEDPTQPRASRAVRATSGARQGGEQGFFDAYIGYGRRPWSETKPFFLTSEFLTLVLAAIGVGIAMATSDLLDAHRGWTLMVAIAIGYMVSRGLAKSGARDPNPEPRYRD